MAYSFFIFTIPMVLSVITGFAIVAILFPYWLFRPYTLTPRRKAIALFALIGLLVSLAFVGKYALTRTEIVSLSMWVWPASLGLGALDPPGSATVGQVVLITSLAMLSNVGLYAWVGWFVGSFLNRRNSG